MKIRVLYFISTFIVTTALVVGLASYVSPEFNSYVLHKSAPLEVPGLEFRLGDLYFKGAGEPRDLKKAEQWYLKAAKAGYAKAMYKLGNLYSHRVGMERGAEKEAEFWSDIPLDYQKAIECYSQTAGRGHLLACLRLGYFNLCGIGMPVNYPRSFSWYQKAAKAGHPKGQSWLGYFYSHGLDSHKNWIVTPSCWNGVEKNYAKSLKWYERSARHGLVWAQYMTGYFYAHGDATVGWGPAMYYSCLTEIKGVPLDYNKAVYWLTKAAAQNSPAAMCELGYLHLHGNYAVKQNFHESFRWYLKGARLGDEVCMRKVGSLYEDGVGTSKDDGQALMWYRRASAAGDYVASQYLKAWAKTGHS